MTNNYKKGRLGYSDIPGGTPFREIISSFTETHAISNNDALYKVNSGGCWQLIQCNVRCIYFGNSFCMMILTDGRAYYSGSNQWGRLGNGTCESGSSGYVCCDYTYCQLAISNSTVVGLKTDGKLVSWGSGCNGMLGNGSVSHVCVPTVTCNSYTFKCVKAAQSGFLALHSDGSLATWGFSSWGQLGRSGYDGNFNPIYQCTISGPGGDKFSQIYSGTAYVYSIIISENGKAYASGWAADGRLGDARTDSNCCVTSFSPVCGDYTYSKLILTGEGAIGIKTDGTAVAWGSNDSGQLGDGTITTRSTPVAVCCNYCYIDISVGSCAVLGLKINEFGVQCLVAWGYNVAGQLGDDTNVNKCQPVAVCCNYDYTYIKTSCCSSYGVKSNGRLVAWGSNYCGKLGDGTCCSKCKPVDTCKTF
jgi:alpha-tubulin suppressor-like RCC1 family protein